MQHAVMAIFFHSSSTDSCPQHFLCPPGATSWCKFKRCDATGAEHPKHNTVMHPQIAPFVKEQFKKLSIVLHWWSGVSLGLESEQIQNQNESVNSMIWNRCPKTEFTSPIAVEIAVDLAVVTFNSGHNAWKDLLQKLDYDLGPTLLTFLSSKDETRVWMAEYKQQELIKKKQTANANRPGKPRRSANSSWRAYIWCWGILKWFSTQKLLSNLRGLYLKTYLF